MASRVVRCRCSREEGHCIFVVAYEPGFTEAHNEFLNGAVLTEANATEAVRALVNALLACNALAPRCRAKIWPPMGSQVPCGAPPSHWYFEDAALSFLHLPDAPFVRKLSLARAADFMRTLRG